MGGEAQGASGRRQFEYELLAAVGQVVHDVGYPGKAFERDAEFFRAGLDRLDTLTGQDELNVRHAVVDAALYLNEQLLYEGRPIDIRTPATDKVFRWHRALFFESVAGLQ